jgi:hypothetical protein
MFQLLIGRLIYTSFYPKGLFTVIEEFKMFIWGVGFSRKVVRKAEAGPEPSNYAAAPTHPQMAIIPPFLDFKER